jgi:hypothetical protein
MKFDDKHSYDKPAATVIKMYSDRAFFERKYKELGAEDIEVLECETVGNKFRIKCRFKVKNNAPLPDFARKFMAEMNTVTQQDSWDLKALTGRIETEIKGVPVKVSAVMTLKDEGAGASNNLKWDVSCGIPFIGGKLESVVADDIKAKSATDSRTSRRLLAGY